MIPRDRNAMFQNPDSAMHLEQNSAMNPSADFGYECFMQRASDRVNSEFEE